MSEIYHHGIKGQKWGVRRFQNADGTRTSAGKRRARQNDAGSMSDEELNSRVRRMNMEKQYNKLSKERANSKVEDTKRLLDATSATVKQAKKLNQESIDASRKRETLDLSKMTDKQLRDRINRANLERQYNDMFARETVSISKGQRYVSKALDVGGDVLAIGSSALAIAVAIKELSK